MHPNRLLRAGALALAIATIPAAARAGEDGKQLRERIAAGITAGLASHAAADTAAPHSLPSRPSPLPARAPHLDGARHAPAPAVPAVRDTTPEGTWNQLVAGNARFAADHPRAASSGRERIELAAGQRPRAIVLGCSDSRVSPEIVFDQSLGELFVVRTAGNIADPIALGSIEYAVEHLHAHLLVVLGHSGCGAVMAAAAGDPMPTAHLQAIVDRIRPAVQRLANCFEGDELIERGVTANARQSATDVLANSELLRSAVVRRELKVVSAVYDLRSGLVTAVTAPVATAQAQAPAR